MTELDSRKQAELVQRLMDQLSKPDMGEAPQLVETHISRVILSGDRAWKFKKPVNFGFLDFTRLESRRHFCEEELRLNRRLADALYLGVRAVGGSPEQPVWLSADETDGPALDYAVEMRRFQDQDRLDTLLASGQLTAADMEAVADHLARFHAEAAVAAVDTPWGVPETVLAPMQENFRQLDGLIEDPEIRALLSGLEARTEADAQRLGPLLKARKAASHIRECHGDLHLANLARFQGEFIAFDGIEFNEGFRWIDTGNDLAFLLMDLHARGQPALAAQVLNRYLECSGDYGLLPLLGFYLRYRALVRAKINGFQAAQQLQSAPDEDEAAASARLRRRAGFLREAADYVRLAGQLDGSTSSRIAEGRYSPQTHAETYARLLSCAGQALAGGMNVVLDATFVRQAGRRDARNLAEAMAAGFGILAPSASEELLQQRVAARHAAGTDASEADLAVLTMQLAEVEPPTEAEQRLTLNLNATRPPEALAAEVRHWLQGRTG